MWNRIHKSLQFDLEGDPLGLGPSVLLDAKTMRHRGKIFKPAIFHDLNARALMPVKQGGGLG